MIRAIAFALTLAGSMATPAFAQQMIGSCPVLPADNIWNTAVDTLPVLAGSATLVNTIGAGRGFHADFGAGMWDGGPIGIPFVTVRGTQPKYAATFLYDDESDRGPYAVPLTAPIEGGAGASGDRHAIAIDTDSCTLYELYRAFPGASSWTADSGAIYDLRSNALRPSGWTSADAAGLPIMPGLVTWDEVQSGEIRHAIRFTAPQTKREFVWPARHYASSLTGAQYPRMGERFRLKASFDISTFPADVQVILRAMKKYGIILADNGSAWYISGKPDPRWNDDNLHTLSRLLGSNFEAVDATVLRISADSGAAKPSGPRVTVTPPSASIRVGNLHTFSAALSGVAGGVTWSVNDVPGGDGSVGTIDTSGRYLAPATVPNPSAVTIRATSVAAPTASGSATVTVLPLPSIGSVSPASFPAGPVTLTINGSGFTPGAVVSLNGVALSTTFVASNRLTAAGTVASAGTLSLVATMSDGTVSNRVTVTVTAAPAPAVRVTVSPASASVPTRQSYQFAAAVTGTSNAKVVWKVNGVAGGNSTVGRVNSAGVYTAPSRVPSPATVNLTATSVADPTKSGTARVTLRR
jgi:hypothetical protein